MMDYIENEPIGNIVSVYSGDTNRFIRIVKRRKLNRETGQHGQIEPAHYVGAYGYEEWDGRRWIENAENFDSVGDLLNSISSPS